MRILLRGVVTSNLFANTCTISAPMRHCDCVGVTSSGSTPCRLDSANIHSAARSAASSHGRSGSSSGTHAAVLPAFVMVATVSDARTPLAGNLS